MTWTSATDLARLLSVPVGTIHRWANEDDWPRVGRGRRVRYNHERAVESYETRRKPAMSVHGVVQVPDESNPDALIKRIGNAYFIAPAHGTPTETPTTPHELPKGWIDLGYVTDEGVS